MTITVTSIHVENRSMSIALNLRTHATISSQLLGTPAMHIQQCMFSSRLSISL